MLPTDATSLEETGEMRLDAGIIFGNLRTTTHSSRA